MYILIAIQVHTDYYCSANDDYADDAERTHTHTERERERNRSSHSHIQLLPFYLLEPVFFLILVLIGIFGELVSWRLESNY